MSTDVQEQSRAEAMASPRWRNWWRLYPPTYVRCNLCETFHRSPDAGAPFDYSGCCQTYESRFEAELNAKEEYDPSCDQASEGRMARRVSRRRTAMSKARPNEEVAPSHNEGEGNG